jgi:hypothetical protein
MINPLQYLQMRLSPSGGTLRGSSLAIGAVAFGLLTRSAAQALPITLGSPLTAPFERSEP